MIQRMSTVGEASSCFSLHTQKQILIKQIFRHCWWWQSSSCEQCFLTQKFRSCDAKTFFNWQLRTQKESFKGFKVIAVRFLLKRNAQRVVIMVRWSYNSSTAYNDDGQSFQAIALIKCPFFNFLLTCTGICKTMLTTHQDAVNIFTARRWMWKKNSILLINGRK